MSIDIAIVRDLDTFYTTNLENEGEYFIYKPRFTKANSPFGKCPRCYDDTTGQVTDSQCTTCFGTGFNGGYDEPLTGINAPYQRVLGILNANAVVTDWQPAGIISSEEDQKVYLRMNQQPALSDMMVGPDGARYRIGTHIEDWNYRGIQFGYIAIVFQQSPSDMIYKVPVPQEAQITGGEGIARSAITMKPAYVAITKTGPA